MRPPQGVRISADVNANHVFVDKNDSKSIYASISKITEPQRPKIPKKETDPATLARRRKQIDYGKRTVGYQNYVQLVPIEDRTSGQPKTPIPEKKMSRRCWDGQIKIWRLLLHAYDDKDVSRPQVSPDHNKSGPNRS